MTVRSLALKVSLGAALAALLAWGPLAWRIAGENESTRIGAADRIANATAVAMQRRLGGAFDGLADRLAWMASTPGVADAFREFEEAFWAISPDPAAGGALLRRHYTKNVPLGSRTLYLAVHDKLSPLMAGMKQGAGVADLLLVEPKRGAVIYAVGKGKRFGEILAEDDPATTVAHEVLRGQSGALFSGFAEETGRIGDGWLAAPIRVGETTVGALLARIPPQTILAPLSEIADIDPTLWLGLYSAEGRLLAQRGAPHPRLTTSATAAFAHMSGEAGSYPLTGDFGRWQGVARGVDLAAWPGVGVVAAPMADGKRTATLLLTTGLLAVVSSGALAYLLFRSIARPLTAHVNQISHLSQTGSEPEEGGFAPSGLSALDDLVGDLARSLGAHRAETEKERSALQAYIDQLESSARVAALAGDGDGSQERKSRRKVTQERSFAEATWPRIKTSLDEAIGALKTLEGDTASHAATVMEQATRELTRGFAGMAGPPEISSGTFTGIDLAALAMERAKRLSPRAEKKDIEITFQRSDEQTVVRGDKEGLTKMIDALLDNALAYTHPGGAVTVRVEKENDIVRLTVADTGLGLAQGEEKKIFERFRQGTAAAAIGQPGLGLGLSDAHAIALAHGARLVGVNGVERGALFTVEFPDGLGPRQPTLPGA